MIFVSTIAQVKHINRDASFWIFHSLKYLMFWAKSLEKFLMKSDHGCLCSWTRNSGLRRPILRAKVGCSNRLLYKYSLRCAVVQSQLKLSKHSLSSMLSQRMQEQYSRIKKNSQLMSMRNSIISKRRLSSMKSMVACGNLSTRALNAENKDASSSINESYDDHHSLFLSTDTGDDLLRRVSFVALPRRLSNDSSEASGSLDDLWDIHNANVRAPESRNLSAMLDAVEANDSNIPSAYNRKSGKNLRFAMDDVALDV